MRVGKGQIMKTIATWLELRSEVSVRILKLLIICFGVSTTTYAAQSASESLEIEVVEAESLKQKMLNAANTIDNDSDIGVMHINKDLKIHTCYSLGVLLGKRNYVDHLKFKRLAAVQANDRDDAYSLRIQARSLENFQNAVKATLKLTQEDRTIRWNIDCVGQYSIRGGFDSNAKNTFFRVQNQGKVIQILGDIGPDFSTRLQSAINSNPGVTTIALGSGGGYVSEAMKAGRLIRSKQLDTTLWNNCYSACPLVFLGGKDRLIYDPFPYLGFHKIRIETGPIPASSPVYKSVSDYVSDMGASSRLVLDWMLSAEPSQMLVIQGKTLCESNVATFIQRLCKSEEFIRAK